MCKAVADVCKGGSRPHGLRASAVSAIHNGQRTDEGLMIGEEPARGRKPPNWFPIRGIAQRIPDLGLVNIFSGCGKQDAVMGSLDFFRQQFIGQVSRLKWRSILRGWK